MSSSTSRLDVLAEVCSIVPEKTNDIEIDIAAKILMKMKNDVLTNVRITKKMKEEALLPPKKRKSYYCLNFLNNMPNLDVLADIYSIAPEKTNDVEIDIATKVLMKMKNNVVANVMITNKMKERKLVAPKRNEKATYASVNMSGLTMPTPACPTKGNELGKEAKVPLPILN
ncbi:unnamed protein product [Malus baccata var. baccata]